MSRPQLYLAKDGILWERFAYNSYPIDERLKNFKVEAGEIPAGTCPKIDSVIESVNKAMTHAEKARKEKDDVAEAADQSDDAYRALDAGVHATLEDIRADNEKLRALGKFWYLKACDLVMEIGFLRAEIEELKQPHAN